MRAGSLSEVITIQQSVYSQDEFGASSLNWIDFVTTRANIKYLNGNRVNENQEIVFTYEYDFIIRNYHSITEDMRIIWKGNKYRILTIEEDKHLQQKLIRTEKIND